MGFVQFAKRLVLPLLVLSCALFVSPSPTRAKPRFEEADCMMDVPRRMTVECGYLEVPENRLDSQNDKTIQLYVAIIKGKGTTEPDPVLYLEGGPGGSAVLTVEYWVNSPLLQDRDVILLDQRGTGLSEPSLNCVELEKQALNYSSAIRACRRRLIKEDVDLSAYNSAQSAADIADLREALGYKEINLFGVSYGTRLALTVMRDHPEGIRSVVLDSVYPPQVNLVEEVGPNTIKVFDTLFNGCAKNSACNKAFPNLQRTFYQLVDKLNKKPIRISYKDSNGKTQRVQLTGDDLVDLLFLGLYSTPTIPDLPALINDVSRGKYVRVSNLMNKLQLQRPLADGDLTRSEGMHLSVNCTEEVPFSNESKAIRLLDKAPAQIKKKLVADVRSVFARCKIWDVEQADDIETEPVESDIPTLVLSGAFDPITPPAWAAAASRTLSNSYSFVFPGVGHGVTGTSRCADRILTAFLNKPTTKPSASCIAQLKEPTFKTR